MRVEAIRLGYYDLVRRKPGTVFELKTVKGLDKEGKPISLTPEQQFSSKWMKKTDTDLPRSNKKERIVSSRAPTIEVSSSGDEEVI